jgi:hypothetical protein
VSEKDGEAGRGRGFNLTGVVLEEREERKKKTLDLRSCYQCKSNHWQQSTN